MAIEHGARAGQRAAIAKMNGLRQLNDGVIRKRSDYLFAQSLVQRPQVAKIHAAVEQDRPVTDPAGQLLSVMREEIGSIAQALDAERSETRELPEPDRAVTDIPVIREIHERNRAVAGQQRPECRLDRVAQRGDEAEALRHAEQSRMWGSR